MASANETVDKPAAVAAAASKLSLATCSSQDLATWLLENRFGDEMEVTTFLLSAISALPNAETIANELCQEDDTAQNENSTLGARLSDESWTLSLISPRGKFEADFYEQGLQLVDSKKNALIIKPRTINYLIIFPKPEDARAKHSKTLTQYALLVFQNDVECHYKNKPLKQICLQLPSNENDSFTLVDRLCVRLEVNHESVVHVSDSTFSSHNESDTSTTTGGMPFIQCYQGVNDGVLFPLKVGLLFFKPPLFVSRTDILSVACGRHGSDIGGRYIDLAVLKTDNSELQFTNIHKAEATELNKYIKCLISDGEDKSDDGSDASDEKEDDSTEVEDAGPRRDGRPSRKASQAARVACRSQKEDVVEEEEDEGDEDYVVARATLEDEESDSDNDDDAENGKDDDNDEDDSSEEDGGGEDAEDTESEDEDERPKRKKVRSS